MQPIKCRCDDVVIVDPRLNDYEQLVDTLKDSDVPVHRFSAGEDALRAAAASASTLWLVNIRLPDTSGTALLKLLRRRLRRLSVLLVGDVYSAEDELAARTAGATAYVCKPPSVAWLDAYHQHRREPAASRAAEDERASVVALRPP